jgi:hypothetical protein
LRRRYPRCYLDPNSDEERVMLSTYNRVEPPTPTPNLEQRLERLVAALDEHLESVIARLEVLERRVEQLCLESTWGKITGSD